MLKNKKLLNTNIKGMTLIELLIVMAIIGFVLAAGYSMYWWGIKSFDAGLKRSETHYKIRGAAQFITSKIRFANNLEILSALPTLDANSQYIYSENGSLKYWNGSTSTTFADADGSVNFDPIVFNNPASGILTFIVTDSSSNYSISTNVKLLNYTNFNSTTANGSVIRINGTSADSGTKVEVPVTSVTLNISALTLTTGSGGLLTATVEPSNATNKTITWISSNPSIATVTEGLISGIAAGTTTVTASAYNGYSAACTVIVNPDNTYIAVTSVTLNPTAISNLKKGNTYQLTATVYPANSTNKSVTWSSDNSNISVSSSGLVTVKKNNSKAIITVTTTDSKKTAQCTVNY